MSQKYIDASIALNGTSIVKFHSPWDRTLLSTTIRQPKTNNKYVQVNLFNRISMTKYSLQKDNKSLRSKKTSMDMGITHSPERFLASLSRQRCPKTFSSAIKRKQGCYPLDKSNRQSCSPEIVRKLGRCVPWLVKISLLSSMNYVIRKHHICFDPKLFVQIYLLLMVKGTYRRCKTDPDSYFWAGPEFVKISIYQCLKIQGCGHSLKNSSLISPINS